MSKFLFFDENKEILRRLIEKRFHLSGDAIIAGSNALKYQFYRLFYKSGVFGRVVDDSFLPVM
ncbi:hypothetical protein [Aeromonas hydrophila]|uniref:hypothetical protein n=1 Tax=Aeromonas hydrophila TaxID=644 RepID=UPI003EC546AD